MEVVDWNRARPVPAFTSSEFQVGSGSLWTAEAFGADSATQGSALNQYWLWYSLPCYERVVRSLSGSPGESMGAIGDWFLNLPASLVTIADKHSSEYAKAVDQLKSELNVSLSFIARCLGVRRSALYKWYEGSIPQGANRSRLNTISEFSEVWREANLPSLRNYWELRMPGTSSTIGEILSSSVLDVNLLRTILEFVMHHSKSRSIRGRRFGFPNRKRNLQRDQERLSVISSPISRESIED